MKYQLLFMFMLCGLTWLSWSYGDFIDDHNTYAQNLTFNLFFGLLCGILLVLSITQFWM